jgi:nucleotide-binding universal stress UspA family protein
MQIKKILVPTELDNHSMIASEFAVFLASKLNASEVILLNLIVPVNHHEVFIENFSDHNHGNHSDNWINSNGNQPFHLNEFNRKRLHENEQILAQWSQQLTTPRIMVSSVVRFTCSLSNINSYMEEFGADIIIYGSPDKHSFMEMMFESTTEKIIRKIDYPIIVISRELSHHTIRNIALAIDINAESSREVDAVLYIVRQLNAHLQLVYIIDDDLQKASEAIQKLQLMAKQHSITDYSINIINNDNIENGLQSFVRKFNPDMIAILSQRKGKFNKIIYGEHTDEIIKEMRIPVIVCKS